MARKNNKGTIVDMAVMETVLAQYLEKKGLKLVKGSVEAKQSLDIELKVNGKVHKATFVTGTKSKKGYTLKATRVTFAGVKGSLYF